MAQKKVVETDGLAGINAGAVGSGNNSVLDTDQVMAKTRGEQHSVVAKDHIEDQHVLYTDIGGTGEDSIRRTTPESA